METVIVNDLEVDYDDQSRSNFIFLPRACLQKGKNRVSVMYQSRYNNDSSGLVSFMDDGEQFLYTQFEPYYANRVFPCFDQPNLKSIMRLTVICREDWRVLSNERAITNESFKAAKYIKNTEWSHQKSRKLIEIFSSKVVNANNSKITTFPATKPLHTEVLCFAAGNYQ